MDAERLIPHRAPMRLVDTLVSVNDGCAVAESVLPRSAIMLVRGRTDSVTPQPSWTESSVSTRRIGVRCGMSSEAAMGSACSGLMGRMGYR